MILGGEGWLGGRGGVGVTLCGEGWGKGMGRCDFGWGEWGKGEGLSVSKCKERRG